MWTALTILTLAGALAALVTGLAALGAWLRFRRTRVALLTSVAVEVARLAGRTAELAKSLASLDARAAALPGRISELHQNLTTLRVLTNALAVSLRQAQRVLSPAGLKTSLAKPLADVSKNFRNGSR